jgi:hypothetical protein
MTEPTDTPPGEDEIPLLLADLASADVQDRVAVLKVLAEDPTGDPRVAAAIEPLLDDRTPCVLTAPPSYGELRWLAAHALAAERHAGGQPPDVLLRDAVAPMNAEQLAVLAQQVLGAPGDRLRALQQFQALAQAGALPRRDFHCRP